MKTETLILAAGGLILMLLASLAAAQSLGDLARQEQAKRAQETKKAAKVFTNDDFPAPPPTAEARPAAPASEAEAETAAPAEETPAAPQAEEPNPEDKQKTRDYWQGRFRAAMQRIAEAEEPQRLSEDELSLLQIQAARELSPDAQSDLEARVKAKNTEVESNRAQAAKARKALADLEREFKESGAPADWGKTD
jgi:hypothetical protein